ncbi:hypothetical protein lerEdw1_005996 [Lerista edwardsae]|nr:hypothetical protein lerEdw1_005996 [Lerista edwardsae]
MTFADVVVQFSPEEWGMLSVSQRELYQEVTLENYASLDFLGLVTAKPPLVSELEEGKEPSNTELPGAVQSPSLGREQGVAAGLPTPAELVDFKATGLYHLEGLSEGTGPAGSPAVPWAQNGSQLSQPLPLCL